MPKQKILIISPRAFGYVEYIASALKKHNNIEVNLFYIEFPGYKNTFQKVKNFFLKTFFGINIKKSHKFLIENIDDIGVQDKILIIRPDLLSDKTLNSIKKYTNNFIAYYWDSAERLERKQNIIHFFDQIYSFDKHDVAKYNFEFITNYIFKISEINTHPEYLFFNISGNDEDYRFKQLEYFATYLKKRNWTFKFISVHHKPKSLHHDTIEIVPHFIEVQKATDLIDKTKILVEFQRKQQIGLSFRVFEALGMQKKLITNNKDIVNYDFYNAQNILVIDENNPIVPDEFVSSPYVPIESTILDQYKIETWVEKVFDLKQYES